MSRLSRIHRRSVVSSPCATRGLRRTVDGTSMVMAELGGVFSTLRWVSIFTCTVLLKRSSPWKMSNYRCSSLKETVANILNTEAESLMANFQNSLQEDWCWPNKCESKLSTKKQKEATKPEIHRFLSAVHYLVLDAPSHLESPSIIVTTTDTSHAKRVKLRWKQKKWLSNVL